MKRVQPISRYDEDLGYPSVVVGQLGTGPGVHRRGFFTGVMAGAVAAGGSVLFGSSGARAGKKRAWVKVKLPFAYRLSGCKLRIDRLIVQSRDPRVVRFLQKKSEWPGMRKALKATFARHKCADLHDAKRLARMEKAAARTLAAHYRRASQRKAGALLLNVVAANPRPFRTYGWAAPPASPVNPLLTPP